MGRTIKTRRRKGGSKERRADPGTSKADGQDD